MIHRHRQTAPASRVRLAGAALCGSLLLGACAPTQDTGADSGGDDAPMTPPTASAPGADSDPARAAVADLAAELSVEDAAITVDSVEDVTWRDGSLGCAEQGTMYTQALVEGTRITLSVDGETYEYHAGGDRPPFLCPDPTE
ncbi:hypothetical protein [Nocardioides donggukensis]|uniref:Lipoprotein n=1 Tax=Nocardioides donggukensis TaxID=2774019 RepID=A0A927Q0Y5_9ACTN|nr:hypothetical protein [Nocardioides donggukensis]MBD8869462.1 hypothetical protein [Nocardioides donggukensis]